MLPVRLHLVGQAQCNTTRDFPLCGFTKKTMAFAAMMKGAGHTVYLYGGSANEAPCDEFIPCVSEAERVEVLEWKHYVYPSWSPTHPTRVAFNERLVKAIGQRHQTGDIVCLLGGIMHLPVIEAFPHVVEFGVGYSGVAAKYIIWESHSWRAIVSGAKQWQPRLSDDVIPGFFTVPDINPVQARDGYLLYVGRITEQKGVPDACMAAAVTGKRLLVAGYGEKKYVGHGATYLGPVSEAERVRLMAGAAALICPTRTFEPFGNVSCEAQLCGTPVIATRWGGFLDTVIDGQTGYLAGHPGEIVEAIGRLGDLLPPALIRHGAISRYSPDAVLPLYERYFQRITTGSGC